MASSQHVKLKPQPIGLESPLHLTLARLPFVFSLLLLVSCDQASTPPPTSRPIAPPIPNYSLEAITPGQRSASPIRLFDYEREKMLQANLDLFTKADQSTWQQDEVLTINCAPARKLITEAKLQAKSKTNSLALQTEVLASIKGTEAFKTAWEQARGEFTAWLKAAMTQLQEDKQIRWHYAGWHWKNYDVASEKLTLAHEGGTLEVPLSLQTLETIRKAYDSRWRKEAMDRAYASQWHDWFIDNYGKYGYVERIDSAQRAIKIRVREEYAKRTMPSPELADYVTPVLNTHATPNRLAIVGNAHQILVEWAVTAR
jgi:hypothetical protein